RALAEVHALNTRKNNSYGGVANRTLLPGLRWRRKAMKNPLLNKITRLQPGAIQPPELARITGKGTTPPPPPLPPEPFPEAPPRYSCSLVVRRPRTPCRSINRCQEVNSSEESE